MIGQKFNMLTVLEYSHKNSQGKFYICKCDCGNETIVRMAKLKNSHTKSCGCLAKKNSSTHGLSKEPLYIRWCGIKSRCYNPKNSKYAYYGGRGVKICDEWVNDYLRFRQWCLDNGYSNELKLDRIDNDKDYSPTNCRFVTHKENMNNTRVYSGIVGLLKQVANDHDLTYSNVRSRYYRLKEKGIEPTVDNILNYK